MIQRFTEQNRPQYQNRNNRFKHHGTVLVITHHNSEKASVPLQSVRKLQFSVAIDDSSEGPVLLRQSSRNSSGSRKNHCYAQGVT